MFGFAFLYVPILSMIAFSFNESKLVTVWGGFSFKWYGELLHNRAMLDAAWLSLRIATVTATWRDAHRNDGRPRASRGSADSETRTLFSAMVTAPLVMPEVITGLSLLLLFVALAPLPMFPDARGFSTIAIAHITLTMSYVTVIVQSRLSSHGRIAGRSRDGSRRTAMEGLRGHHLADHCAGDDFGMAAGVYAYRWMILVIASFTAGPSTNTLPMMIFSSVRRGVSPEINALATIMVGIVTVFVVIAGISLARQETRRQRDVQLADEKG